MHEIPYKIYLSHGESLHVDWEEAYEVYKAICIRKNLPFLTALNYLETECIEVDNVTFKRKELSLSSISRNSV